MNGKLAPLTLLLVLGCTGPTPKPAPVPEAATPPPAAAGRLTGTVTAVNVYDERSRVSEQGRLLYMPQNTIVGQNDDVYPPIDDAIREAIRDETSDQFSPGPRRFEAHIYVVEGRQSFRVEELRERAEVSFAIRVELVVSGGGDEVWLGEGRASRTIEDLDLARSQIELIYEEAVHESVRTAFAGITVTR